MDMCNIFEDLVPVNEIGVCSNSYQLQGFVKIIVFRLVHHTIAARTTGHLFLLFPFLHVLIEILI